MNTVENLIIERLKEFLGFIKIDDFEFEVEKNILIEATAIKANTGERTTIIKVEVNESNEAVYISNIFLPFELRKLGIGKRLIWLIFMVAIYHDYSTYLIMLTDSFRERMLRRGAVPTSEYDVLKITKNTNLYSENDPNNSLYFRI